MPYRITNRSAGPVLLRLRSGRTVHLRAGEHSPDLEGSEVNGNPRIGSLTDRGLVDVEELPAEGPAPAARKRAAKTAAKK